MTDNFQDALKRVLVSEGGRVDNPKDPGGRTNKGITQRVYNGWRAKNNLPSRDVYEIADNEVEAIYRFQYWEPIMGDHLPVGVSYFVFDGAVLSGVGQAVKWLQRSLGALYTGSIDGDMGAGTLGAVAKVDDYDALIARMADRREAFYKALKTFPTFGKGWLRRLVLAETAAQAMASGSVGPDPIFVQGGNAKANLEDAHKAPGKGVADGSTGIGAGGAATTVVLKQLQDQLAPYSTTSNWIGTLMVALIIASAVLALGGLAYRFYSNKRKAELSDALDLQPVSK